MPRIFIFPLEWLADAKDKDIEELSFNVDNSVLEKLTTLDDVYPRDTIEKKEYIWGDSDRDLEYEPLYKIDKEAQTIGIIDVDKLPDNWRDTAEYLSDKVLDMINFTYRGHKTKRDLQEIYDTYPWVLFIDVPRVWNNFYGLRPESEFRARVEVSYDNSGDISSIKVERIFHEKRMSKPGKKNIKTKL